MAQPQVRMLVKIKQVIENKQYSISCVKHQVHEFSVEMTCGGCSGAVEKVLGKLGGTYTMNVI